MPSVPPRRMWPMISASVAVAGRAIQFRGRRAALNGSAPATALAVAIIPGDTIAGGKKSQETGRSRAAAYDW